MKLFTPATALLAVIVLSSCVVHRSAPPPRTTHVVVHQPQPMPRTVTVNAWSNDISNNLDLRAVASVFATSRNLREFEMRLNDPRLGISNLDLTGNGFVDYLRAVEVFDRRQPNTRIVVIQAVLGFNMFQDVATIVVEGRNSRNAVMYVIGDPWLFGRNYIIMPVFHQPPVIFGSFWGPGHVVWVSPYTWGHFPPVWVHNRPVVITNVYINNIHVNNVVNVNTRFNYRTTVSNQQTVNRMQNTVSRDDFARNNPNQSFNHRQTGVSNTREMQVRDENAANVRQKQTQQQPGNVRQPATQQPTDTRQQQQPGNVRQPATQQPTDARQQQQPGNVRQPATQQPTDTRQQQQPANVRQTQTQQQPTDNVRQPATQQQQQPANVRQQPTTQPQQQQNNVRQTQTQQQQQQQTRQAAPQQQQPANNRQATQQPQQNTRQTNTDANQQGTTNRQR